MQQGGGRLILTGVHERVYEQLELTETTETIPAEDIFLADELLGSSTRKALEAAHAWLELESAAADVDREQR